MKSQAELKKMYKQISRLRAAQAGSRRLQMQGQTIEMQGQTIEELTTSRSPKDLKPQAGTAARQLQSPLRHRRQKGAWMARPKGEGSTKRMPTINPQETRRELKKAVGTRPAAINRVRGTAGPRGRHPQAKTRRIQGAVTPDGWRQ